MNKIPPLEIRDSLTTAAPKELNRRIRATHCARDSDSDDIVTVWLPAV